MLLRVKDETARNWYMWSTRQLDKQIFASKYELALPKPEELAYQIKMDRLLIEERMKSSEEEKDR